MKERDKAPVVMTVPVARLRSAPWNYKQEETPDAMAKLVQSIRRDRSAGVLAVRWLREVGTGWCDVHGEIHANKDGVCSDILAGKGKKEIRCGIDLAPILEVIDGNHRLEAVTAIGWETATVEDFGAITLGEAVTIAERRNTEWFPRDSMALGKLLADHVIPETPVEELAEFMPQTKEGLLTLAALGGMVDEVEFPDLPDGEKGEFQQMTFTVHDDQAETIKDAIRAAKDAGPFVGPNENSNGNALARIAETALNALS